jgi:Spy/CpxP family protein refolding chaperone
MGPRYRRGHLAPTLGLTEAQQEKSAQLDPAFEADVAQLAEAVRTQHRQFRQNLADPDVSDAAVESSLEELIAARTRLEQRTVEHVLRIRPLLSTEQQQRLIGLSQRGCRWRRAAELDGGE